LQTLVLLTGILPGCGVEQGQVIRVGTPKPQFSGSGTLSVTVSPSSQTMTLQHSSDNYIAYNLTTSWTGSTTGGINVYAYVTSTRALVTADGSASIPNTALNVLSFSGGVCFCYQTFTGSVPVAGYGAQVVAQGSQALTTGSRTDTMYILVELGNLPQQPAGVYTGTIYFIAQEY
jgi:hypothetical protein